MPRPRVLVLLTAALGVLVLSVLVVDLDESAGVEEGVTLNDVAEHPERYAGETVTISGEIAENSYLALADADVALAIGDDAGRRLLVFPQPGTEVPRSLTNDTVVRVRGVVRVVGPNADGRAADGFVGQGGLLARVGPEAVIEASIIDPVAEKRAVAPAPPAIMEATVRQLLEDPETFDERPVVVFGRAHRVGPAGFVLAADNHSIFVGAPASALGEVDDGEQVRVRAELERLSEFRANTITEALAMTAQTDASTPEGVELDQTPTEQGQPFLVIRTLRGVGPGEPDTGESP